MGLKLWNKYVDDTIVFLYTPYWITSWHGSGPLSTQCNWDEKKNCRLSIPYANTTSDKSGQLSFTLNRKAVHVSSLATNFSPANKV